jgi:hypothetical protein
VTFLVEINNKCLYWIVLCKHAMFYELRCLGPFMTHNTAAVIMETVRMAGATSFTLILRMIRLAANK